MRISKAFDAAFAKTFKLELGYSNNPHDSGGATRFAITEGVARAHGYKGAMRELPLPLAKAILMEAYWDDLSLEAVATLNQPIAEELFDTAVNMGVVTSGKFLQRALNVLNNSAKYYDDLLVDGRIGKVTRGALRIFLDIRGREGETVLLRALNAMQAIRYIEIAEGKETQEDFVYGWLRTRVA